MSDPSQIAGYEARTNLFAGRPIRPGDIGPPAIIERNQLVSLVYSSNGLLISTEGRAMERGGVGDQLRAMNLASRSTVYGTVDPSGAIHVGH
jgi:flagella basal body P-ring formation protein FlgA